VVVVVEEIVETEIMIEEEIVQEIDHVIDVIDLEIDPETVIVEMIVTDETEIEATIEIDVDVIREVFQSIIAVQSQDQDRQVMTETTREVEIAEVEVMIEMVTPARMVTI